MNNQMNPCRDRNNTLVIFAHTEQWLTPHGFPWKSESAQKGKAVISGRLDPEWRDLLISFGQAVKRYLHCSAIYVQAVSLKGSLSVSHSHVSCGGEGEEVVFHLQAILFSLLWVTKIWLKPDIRVLVLSCSCLKKEKGIWNESWEGTRVDDVSSGFLLMPCMWHGRKGEFAKDDTLRAVALTKGRKKHVAVFRDSCSQRVLYSQ